MAYSLPENARFDGVTHVQARQIRINFQEPSVDLQVQYGTTDADGNFVPRDRTTDDVITFSSIAEMKVAVDTLRTAILDYVDNNDLWPIL